MRGKIKSPSGCLINEGEMFILCDAIQGVAASASVLPACCTDARGSALQSPPQAPKEPETGPVCHQAEQGPSLQQALPPEPRSGADPHLGAGYVPVG